MSLERPAGDIWIFGYGSLMWRPNFPHAETRPARLHGYHRALCIYSTAYRGTYEVPGLVFGLDRGGSCRGLAFRVIDADADDVMGYLYEREMINHVYRPKWLTTTLPTGTVSAYTFVADTSHEQYTGKLDDAETVKLALQGCGKSGTCIEYLQNTLAHLEELGIHDGTLERIVRLAEKAGN
jgi:cation transport protein ChaC